MAPPAFSQAGLLCFEARLYWEDEAGIGHQTETDDHWYGPNLRAAQGIAVQDGTQAEE